MNGIAYCSRGCPSLEVIRPLHGRYVRRLGATEAIASVVYAAVALPFSLPGRTEVPDWVSVVGLLVILGLAVANVWVWSLVIGDHIGGRPPTGSRPVDGSLRLREQLRDERRLRVTAAGCVTLTVIVAPIPSTAVAFWFALTVVTTLATALPIGARIVGRRWVRRGHKGTRLSGSPHDGLSRSWGGHGGTRRVTTTHDRRGRRQHLHQGVGGEHGNRRWFDRRR